MKQQFRTRESKGGKTVYGHFDFSLNYASKEVLRKILGDDLYIQATKLYRKGIRKGVLK